MFFLGLGSLYQKKRITAKLGREGVSGETGHSGVSPERYKNKKALSFHPGLPLYAFTVIQQ